MSIFSVIFTDMGCSLTQYRQTIGVLSGESRAPRKWLKERKTTNKLRRGEIIPITLLFLLLGAYLHQMQVILFRSSLTH